VPICLKPILAAYFCYSRTISRYKSGCW
jgi:hypothetical protein